MTKKTLASCALAASLALPSFVLIAAPATATPGGNGKNPNASATASPNPYAPSGVGQGDNQGNGNAPANGTVGNADGKNPPGQAPGGSDKNNGYECDGNKGVGNNGGNPAHSGCKTSTPTTPPPTKSASPSPSPSKSTSPTPSPSKSVSPSPSKSVTPPPSKSASPKPSTPPPSTKPPVPKPPTKKPAPPCEPAKIGPHAPSVTPLIPELTPKQSDTPTAVVDVLPRTGKKTGSIAIVGGLVFLVGLGAYLIGRGR